MLPRPAPHSSVGMQTFPGRWLSEDPGGGLSTQKGTEEGVSYFSNYDLLRKGSRT